MNKKKISLLMIFFFFFLAISAVASTYQDRLYSANINVNNKAEKATSDPTYPIYHLRAPSGWINDPCGIFYYNGSYHIFSQSNPYGNQWGNMSWQQMVSLPAKQWSWQWFYPKSATGNLKTVEIIPSSNSNAADKNGIFTGCVAILPFTEMNANEEPQVNYYPTAVYSGVWGDDNSKQEVICMARALDADKTDGTQFIDPYLTNWTKYSSNEIDPNNNPKIILEQPTDIPLVSFRDPYIFRLPDDSNYYMMVSAGITAKTSGKGYPEGTMLVFKNDGTDLTKNWIRVNSGKNFFFSAKTAIKDPVTGSGDFECGLLYKLTDHNGGTSNDTPYVLIFGQDGPAGSYGKSVFYILGTISKDNGMTFKPLDNFKDKNGPVLRHLDLNPDFVYYAPTTCPVVNEQRNYLYGWLNVESQAKSGSYNWAGALSIPRFLYAYKNKNKNWALGQDPVLVDSVHNTKNDKQSSMTQTFTDHIKEIELIRNNGKKVTGRYLNISAQFSNIDFASSDFGIKVACTHKNEFPVEINDGTLLVNGKNISKLTLPLTAAETKIKLNAYVDGSTFELFISQIGDNGETVTFATYSSALPSYNNKPQENESKVFGSRGISATINTFYMNSCWVDDSTVTQTGSPLNSKQNNGWIGFIE